MLWATQEHRRVHLPHRLSQAWDHEVLNAHEAAIDGQTVVTSSSTCSGKCLLPGQHLGVLETVAGITG